MQIPGRLVGQWDRLHEDVKPDGEQQHVPGHGNLL